MSNKAPAIPSLLSVYVLKWPSTSRWCALLLLLFPVFVHAQRYTIADTALVLKLYKNATDSVNNDTRRSLQLIEQGMTIARQLKNDQLITKGLRSKGAAATILERYDVAFSALLEARVLCGANGDKSVLGSIHTNLAANYYKRGDFEMAIRHFDSSLEAFSAVHNSKGLAHTYGYLASIMSDMGDRDRAIEHYRKAEGLFIEIKDMQMLAVTYDAMGGTFCAQKKYAEGLAKFQDALRIIDSMRLEELYPSIFMNMGVAYKGLGEKDKALGYFLRALGLFRGNGDMAGRSVLLTNIGELYLDMGRPREAEKYYLEGLELAKRSKDLATIYLSHYDLGKVYLMMGNYKQACYYKDLALVEKDSISAQERNRSLAELTTKYETREIQQKSIGLQKENDLQKLKLQRKNILIYSWFGVAVLVFMIGMLLLIQSRLRAEKQKMILEQKQLLAQINPHFIYNCLNSIQQFIIQNDTLNANKYLADFALLMRQTLENSKDGTISLQRELEYLENYLSFEVMRFEDKFTYSITCAEDVDIDRAEIPSMIVQPFVENAIRHGLYNLEGRQGKLTISFYKKNDDLICEVDDNGIGIEQAQRIKEQRIIKHESHGMELTQKRLALVSRMNSTDYNITIVNKKDMQHNPAGTTIVIKFPLEA